tara:strand:- start:409 stop:978 length:570 start_codon:yes stop_codon:yes gene_type:complete
MQRVGLIGGTFDPIHNGHLLLAQFVSEQVSLDKILFIPAADPPHKDKVYFSAAARVEMVSCAVNDIDDMFVSKIELDRPGKSFTVDTLRQLHMQCPEDSYYLIIGDDNISQISSWHDPESILELCTVVVGTRLTGEKICENRFMKRMVLIDTPLFELSSTEIRHRLQSGLPVKGMIPESVEFYIKNRGL